MFFDVSAVNPAGEQSRTSTSAHPRRRLGGDIKAASIRLDYGLMEARASLLIGDVEGARNNLQYAEGTVEKLEKFLG